jgi:hypothetical protein
VYAAFLDPKDLSTNAGFGKTYTLDILRAARRGSSEPIIVLGNDDNVLPDNVSDVARAILSQLGVDSGVINTIPERPSSDLPTAAPNPDKLRRWASEDVPAWFDGVLTTFRLADPVQEARRRIAKLKEINVVPAPEDAERAAQAIGDLKERWPTAWIVVTGLWKSRLTEEVRDFVAGLIGGRSAEDAVLSQLRRLRWVFIGYAPDFLAVSEVTRELLDPRGIGTGELAVGIERLADSLGVELGFADQLPTLIDGLVTYHGASAQKISVATARLPFFQGLFPGCAKAFLQRSNGSGD